MARAAARAGQDHDALRPTTTRCGGSAGRRQHGAVVVMANPGCLLQIGKYLGDETTPLLHPVQLLDASIRGAAVPHR